MGELIQLGGSGGTPSANNPDYYGGDIPFLSIADINGRDITNTAKTLTDEGLQNSAAWIVPSGAVSLAMYASVGKVGIIRQDTATSQAFYNMVFDNEALRDFVFTRLEKAETDSEWEPYISTGTQRNLNADKVKSFSLDVPSNEEASEISAYFANLDTLITLHQRECGKPPFNQSPAWEQRKLGELIQLGGSGGTPSANNPDYYGGDIPFLSIADINGRDITNTAKTLTDEGLQNSAAWIVPSGAVSLAMYASVGKVGIIRQDTATSQAFYNMVFDNEALRDFVFTRLEKAETDSEWEPYISTGTQRNLNADKVKSFSLDVPSNEEASEISAYFANLDTLITLHQRECGKPPFNQSPAWEQRKWSEYVSISTDMVDPRSGNYDNLPHVGPGNMESFTGRLYDNVNTVKDDVLISGKFHFNPGDIIYGKINPQLGKYTYAQFEGLASADAYVLNGKNGLTQEFLFGILQTKAFFDYSVSVSMRSGMPKINRDELNAFEFLAPNESEQRAIGDILLKLDDLITLHQSEPRFADAG